MDGTANTTTLIITPEMLGIIAELDEFKGAWPTGISPGCISPVHRVGIRGTFRSRPRAGRRLDMMRSRHAWNASHTFRRLKRICRGILHGSRCSQMRSTGNPPCIWPWSMRDEASIKNSDRYQDR